MKHHKTETKQAANSMQKNGPLSGLKIIDLTAVVLGPIATQVLADYGADVIKIESPEGDLMRANGVSKHQGMSSIFLNLNRNKRSVVIDLKTPKGRDVLRKLIASADGFIHNMRVNAIERLGFGYEAVKAMNPGIVYCMATGFGEEGPHAGQPAFDDIIQAACGLAELVGRENGQPTYPPALLADKIAGMATANAVLAALMHKARTGEGQCVEVPMFETMVAFTMAEHMGGKTFEPSEGPAGYARLLGGGRKPTPTKDGFISMLPYTSGHWIRFFHHIQRADLAAKYDIEDRHQRNKRIGELYQDLRSVTVTYSSKDLIEICLSLDIPATEIYSIDRIEDHPHLQAVELFVRAQHPSEGVIKVIRPTAKFSDTPVGIRSLAPRLGQDTNAVLQEAGYSAAQIESLHKCAVIQSPGPSVPVSRYEINKETI